MNPAENHVSGEKIDLSMLENMDGEKEPGLWDQTTCILISA